MKSIIILTVLVIQLVSGSGYYPSASTKIDLGNALKHTLTALKDVPLTTDDAHYAGWTKLSECVPNLGNLYAYNGKQTKSNPLGAYYTNAGQLAGIKMNIFGAGEIGDAALPKLVQQGYWIKESGYKRWSISISFRSPSEVCSSQRFLTTIGNQVVINQQGIAKAIPMTQREAVQSGFQPGSCMAAMGQHHLFDLEAAPNFTFKSDNLMPVVPMYHMNGPKKGELATIFLTTPVCQSNAYGNWAYVPGYCGIPTNINFLGIKVYGFCTNWCNSKCQGLKSWGTENWSLMHFFFNSDPRANVKCTSPAWAWDSDYLPGMGRQCPSNAPEPRLLF